MTFKRITGPCHASISQSATRPAEPMADGIAKAHCPRKWREMTDDELVAFARGFLEEKGITCRYELDVEDNGLSHVLRRRKLMDELGLPMRHKDWASMSDGELITHGKKFISQRGIIRKKKLEKADRRLYSALNSRGLSGSIGLLEKVRDWSSKTDAELLEYAIEFVSARCIQRIKEMRKADGGLHKVLKERGIIEELGLTRERTKWNAMTKEQLIIYAKWRLAETGITKRKGLKEADPDLYHAVKNRKLLREMFSEVESSEHSESVDAVLYAVDSFGD